MPARCVLHVRIWPYSEPSSCSVGLPAARSTLRRTEATGHPYEDWLTLPAAASLLVLLLDLLRRALGRDAAGDEVQVALAVGRDLAPAPGRRALCDNVDLLRPPRSARQQQPRTAHWSCFGVTRLRARVMRALLCSLDVLMPDTPSRQFQ